MEMIGSEQRDYGCIIQDVPPTPVPTVFCKSFNQSTINWVLSNFPTRDTTGDTKQNGSNVFGTGSITLGIEFPSIGVALPTVEGFLGLSLINASYEDLLTCATVTPTLYLKPNKNVGSTLSAEPIKISGNDSTNYKFNFVQSDAIWSNFASYGVDVEEIELKIEMPSHYVLTIGNIRLTYSSGITNTGNSGVFGSTMPVLYVDTGSPTLASHKWINPVTSSNILCGSYSSFAGKSNSHTKMWNLKTFNTLEVVKTSGTSSSVINNCSTFIPSGNKQYLALADTSLGSIQAPTYTFEIIHKCGSLYTYSVRHNGSDDIEKLPRFRYNLPSGSSSKLEIDAKTTTGTVLAVDSSGYFYAWGRYTCLVYGNFVPKLMNFDLINQQQHIVARNDFSPIYRFYIRSEYAIRTIYLNVYKEFITNVEPEVKEYIIFKQDYFTCDNDDNAAFYPYKFIEYTYPVENKTESINLKFGVVLQNSAGKSDPNEQFIYDPNSFGTDINLAKEFNIQTYKSVI